MKVISIQYYKSPFGEMILGSSGDQLCLCDWRFRKMRSRIDERITRGMEARYEEGETPVTMSAITQLEDYFRGELEAFDVPLIMVGTPFQQSVWKELMKIPYGETETYMGLAGKVSGEKAIRAIASANGANAISIIIPCHRVVGNKGELVGYAGGLETKKKLLTLENPVKNPEQYKLF